MSYDASFFVVDNVDNYVDNFQNNVDNSIGNVDNYQMSVDNFYIYIGDFYRIEPRNSWMIMPGFLIVDNFFAIPF